MLILYTILVTIVSIFFSTIVSKKTKDLFNPYSIMVYIWGVFSFFAVIIGNQFGFYPMNFFGISFVYAFLITIGIMTLIILNIGSSYVKITDESLCLKYDKSRLSNITDILFVFALIGNILYWNDINKLIPLKSIFENPWLLKNAIVNRQITNSWKYLGRGFSLTGTFIVITLYSTKKKKYFGMLLIYLALAFLNIQKDLILVKLIYIVVPFLLISRTDLKKRIKLLMPLFIIFIIIFNINYKFMTFGNGNFISGLGAYTFGSFHSLQYILDNGYPTNTNLLFGNTFYWVFSILKYINPIFTPPNIIMKFLSSNIVNVYTSLSVIVLDSNGEDFIMIMLMIVYGIYIGFLIGLSCLLINKKNINIATVGFYTSIISCAVRSYMNPTFSFLEIYLVLFYAFILDFLLKKKVLNGFL